MESHRHSAPHSTEYNEVEKMIDQYYDTLRNKKRQQQAKRFAVNIRKHILIHGCPEDDIIAETTTSGNHPDKASNPQVTRYPLTFTVTLSLSVIRSVIH